MIGGFWRRTFAWLFDGLAWSFVVTLIGLALVYAAPNTFGLASAIIRFQSCRPLTSIPPTIPVPPGLTPTAAVHCSASFLGLPYRDSVILIEQRREGNTTTQKTMSYAVDQNLVLKPVYDTDMFLWLAFFGYVVSCEAVLGATWGKYVLGLRVVGPEGERPGWRRSFMRSLILHGPWLSVIVLLIVLAMTGAFFTHLTLLFIAAGLGGLVSLVIAMEVWRTASHGRPSIHDRAAGTRVIRLPRTDPFAAGEAASP